MRHRELGEKYRNLRNDHDKFVREHSTRFTQLARLPYFDTIRQVVIDPMHNLALGLSSYLPPPSHRSLCARPRQNAILSHLGATEDTRRQETARSASAHAGCELHLPGVSSTFLGSSDSALSILTVVRGS